LADDETTGPDPQGLGRGAGRVFARYAEADPLATTRLWSKPGERIQKMPYPRMVAEAEPPATQEDEPATDLAWVTFKVIDDRTEEPIAGIALEVTLPDGSKRQQTTDRDGVVDIREIRAGSCEVRCDPHDLVLDTTYDFVRIEVAG